MLRLIVRIAVLALLAISGIAQAYAGPTMGRILKLENRSGRGLRVIASFLSEDGRVPMLMDEDLLQLDVEVRTEGAKRGQVLETFIDLAPTHFESEIASFADQELPLDVVLVVSAHKDMDSAAQGYIRSAVSEIFKELPGSARVNLIWVTDGLHYFVAHPDRGAEFTDYWEVQSETEIHQFCRKADVDFYNEVAKKGVSKAVHPCGLVGEWKDLETAIEESGEASFEGQYPSILGLPWRYCPNATPKVFHSRDRRDPENRSPLDDEELEKRVRTGGIDVAAELLTRYRRPGGYSLLVYLGDGVDGYTQTLARCQDSIAATCREDKGATDKCVTNERREAGISKKKARRRCQKKCISRRMAKAVGTIQQEPFLEKATTLLPLLRANQIRLQTVLLPSADSYVVERMRLLSNKSGGTFRMADSGDSFVKEARAAITELTSSLVIDLRPTGADKFLEGETLEVRLAASVIGDRRNISKTDWMSATIPRVDRGLVARFHRFKGWLQNKIGRWPANIVLVVLGMLLLFIGLKLFLKIGKGFVKLIKKLFGKGG
ncbi:MAG: hypothetical protein CMH54_01135 [Myxococcales bacterium]|nr:hypothetical protein [Myxococcales bacterium]|tara:strand:- start:1976 stop:3619 length:1644 start_codon:yes stop_codon:yes gene_type:complete